MSSEHKFLLQDSERASAKISRGLWEQRVIARICLTGLVLLGYVLDPTIWAGT